MDMNWIDEIRDPEPRKRYIYNADDYDPQYGDPYYREHSTRADSLWRLYEESGTSITFDAFADESRQTDYRMETGALRDFFNGSQSALSSYRNPMGGNPLIAFGSIGRWDGERTGISSFETFDDLMNGDDSPFKDCEIDHIWDENGILKMRGHHHDGSVEVEIRQLTDQGCEALESYESSPRCPNHHRHHRKRTNCPPEYAIRPTRRWAACNRIRRQPSDRRERHPSIHGRQRANRATDSESHAHGCRLPARSNQT